MKTWQTKGKNKCYQTSLGTTDFDIPMFGYRSAFLIIFSILDLYVANSAKIF